MTRFRFVRPASFFAAALIALPAFAQLLSPNAPPSGVAQPALTKPLPRSTSVAQPLDRIVAVVNNGVVLQSQLDQTVRTVAGQIASHGGKLPQQSVLEKQVLQRLILNQLLIQKAHENGLRVSRPQVDAAVAAIAKQNKMSVPQLQTVMQKEGINYQSFRHKVHDQLLVREQQQKIMQKSVHISDAEINNLLSSPAFKKGEVHLARILVGLPEGANANQIAAAKAKAASVEQQLQAGKSFAALAVGNSSAPEALDGGELGWRRVAELPPPVQKIIDSMQIGGHTQPLRDASGFTILKLEGRRTPNSKHIVTEYHALHLMIRPDAVLNENGADKKITRLYHEIVGGEASFASLAKKYSDDPNSANQGGDMGWFTQYRWGTAVGKRVAAMHPGQISAPFETPDGSWHIIKLLATRQADKGADIAREQARQAIATRKGRQAYQQFLRNLESSAYIRVKVRGLASTSGASAHRSP